LSHEKLGPPPFSFSESVLADLRAEAEHYMSVHGSLLPPTKDWNYLIHRYEIDPARFSRWHHEISRWIARDLSIKDALPSVTVTPSIPLVRPDVPVASVTPEPSSLLLWTVGLVMIWLWLGTGRILERKRREREAQATIEALELATSPAWAASKFGKYLYCPIEKGSR
jgi:hypothetical protein